jgi:hypothetical protein
MGPSRQLTALICVLITAAAWLSALAHGGNEIALVTAALITVLCAAILVLRLPGASQAEERQPSPKRRDEAEQFRRGLFELCAALKLGIRFCEDNLHAPPDRLVEELERMQDHISSFVNAVARPVGFYRRPRWPWQVTSRWRSHP